MKVPTPRSRTSPSGQPLGYLRSSASPAAFGAGVAGALQGMGVEVGALAERVQQRNEQTRNFQVLRDFSQFETDAAEAITNLKRDIPPNTSNFPDQVESVYTTLENDFIANRVPAELQDEFRFRTGQVKQRIIADSLEFQFTQQDSYFRTQLEDEYTKAQNAVATAPDTYEAQSLRLAEAIATTDLSEIEKVELARKMNAGLTAVLYGKTVEQTLRNAPPQGDASEMIRHFEGFRSGAYWDVNAWRTGYGSDTVTRADGTVEAVTKDTIISREDAERDLARRIPEFTATAAGQVGDDVWASLPPPVQAALVSVTYNYGSLPSSVVKAVATGDTEQIASAVEKLSANPERRAQEAEAIRGGGLDRVNSDPLFDSVPLETRNSIISQTATKLEQEANDRAKAEKEQLDAARNSLFVQLHDGTAGRADLLAARQAGLVVDVDDIEKAEGIIEEREELVRDRTFIQGLLAGHGVYNPSTDAGALNKWIGEEGLAEIGKMNTDFFNAAILPTVTKLHDIPTDLIGQLEGMARANNSDMALWALDALAQLQRTDERAFDARVPERLQQDVDFWSARKDYLPTDELLKELRGGLTTAERQQRQMLREEAQTILRTKVGGVTKMQTLVQDVVSEFNQEWFGSPTLGNLPWAARGLEGEFETAFIDAYARYGNEEDASAAAVQQLRRLWDVTFVGGEQFLMKYPPHKVGYTPVDGDYSWIDAQVRGELGLGEDETFQLISDEQTRTEFAAWQQGVSMNLQTSGLTPRQVDAFKRMGPTPPSYMVAVKKDGVWGLRMNGATPDRRFFTQPTVSPQTMAIANPTGLVTPGNIDITQRPQVKNADGSISTVRSMSFNVDGKEILVPTVSDDGRILSDEEAIEVYRRTGKHLGIFDSPEHATAYANRLHEQQDQLFGAEQRFEEFRRNRYGFPGSYGEFRNRQRGIQ